MAGRVRPRFAPRPKGSSGGRRPSFVMMIGPSHPLAHPRAVGIPRVGRPRIRLRDHLSRTPGISRGLITALLRRRSRAALSDRPPAPFTTTTTTTTPAKRRLYLGGTTTFDRRLAEWGGGRRTKRKEFESTSATPAPTTYINFYSRLVVHTHTHAGGKKGRIISIARGVYQRTCVTLRKRSKTQCDRSVVIAQKIHFFTISPCFYCYI